jgi:3'(2'), 5'-bisphosphate nucleotidase
MSERYAKELKVGLAAVKQAAIVCRAVQSQITPDVLEKKDRSPVTVADFASQAVVCKAIRGAFAADPIIGEEDSKALREGDQSELLNKVVEQVAAVEPGADADAVCHWIDFGGAKDPAPRLWTLDPIDGTKGFLRKEQYAISLALIVDGRIDVAVLGCPNLPVRHDIPTDIGAVFYAVRGQGAFVVPLDGPADPVPVKVSTTDETAAARFCESVESGHSSHGDSETVAKLLNITEEPVRLDSQAKYATVARGEADIYMRLPTRKDYVEKIWDHAGGVLLTEEAGGTVTDVLGQPLEFNHGWGLVNNKGVIVTNGPLHERVLAALEEVGVGRDQ